MSAQFVILKFITQVNKFIPAWKAVFAEPLSCSIHAVELGNIQFNHVVVISGCGPLGLGMVAAAKLKNPKLLIGLDLLDWKVIICTIYHVISKFNFKPCTIPIESTIKYSERYMKIHVPSMLAKGVENKQVAKWLRKFIKHSHKGLRKY